LSHGGVSAFASLETVARNVIIYKKELGVGTMNNRDHGQFVYTRYDGPLRMTGKADDYYIIIIVSLGV